MKTSQKFVRRLRERFPMIDPPSTTSDVAPDVAPVVAESSVVSPAKPPVTKRAARNFILRLRERFPMIDPPRVDADPIKDQLSRHMRERFPRADATALAPAGTDGSVSSPEEVGRRGWRIIFTPIPMFRGGGAKGRAARALHGGRVRDFGRLPRYSMIFFFGAMAIWTPVALYLKFAPVRYTSELSLILPGAGVSTSVNLSDIGQASTSANSPYSSPSLSPTVLYKNLLESYSVISRAADMMNMTAPTFGKPVVKLVDETSLIHVSLVGKTPEDAHDRAEAVHQALLTELDKLRDDEIKRREVASIDTIKNYQETVDAVRAKISALQLSSGLNSADQYSGIVTAAETLQIRVAESQTALREKESAVRSLSETLRVSPEIAAATLKAHADPTLGSLSSTSAKDAADLAEMERAYGPKHPKYLNVLSRASSVRARLESRGAAVTGLSEADFRDKIDMNPSGERVVLLARLVTLVMERDGLTSQLKAQSEELAKDRERVRALVDVASKLDTLNRDYKVADAVFASALARINTSKTDIFASYPMLQVAEPPTMPEKASSPNKIIAAAAGAGGTVFLLIGLGLAWVRRPLIDRILAKGGAPHEAA